MSFPNKAKKRLAWVRVEGVLFRKGSLAMAAYFAANAQGFSDRATKLGIVALAAPLCHLLGQKNSSLPTQMAYYALRNMSEDRLSVLGREYFDKILADSLLPEGQDLMQRLHRQGIEILLYSEGLEYALQYLHPSVKINAKLHCNQLEFSGGLATGKLAQPIFGGFSGTQWLLKQAREQGYDLAHSFAYTSQEQDILLLSAVGNPCIVNPSSVLRREGRQMDWPVMEY
jgi:Phosphoserine phosphatase